MKWSTFQYKTWKKAASKLRCGLKTACATLKATTQQGIGHTIHPLHWRYHVDHLQLNWRQLNDNFYIYTLFSKVKSPNRNLCAQHITNGTFSRVFLMLSKLSMNNAQALTEFCNSIGIPDTLICDMATKLDHNHWPCKRSINSTSKLILWKKVVVQNKTK